MTHISTAQQVGLKTYRVLIWYSLIVYVKLVYSELITTSYDWELLNADIFDDYNDQKKVARSFPYVK